MCRCNPTTRQPWCGKPGCEAPPQTPVAGFRRSYTVTTLEIPPKVFDLIKAKLEEAGYGRAYMAGEALDLSGVALVPSEKADEASWHLSKDKGAAVGDHEFLPIETCPKGVKVQLLNTSHSATVGQWDGKYSGFKGWYPVPGIPAAWKDHHPETVLTFNDLMQHGRKSPGVNIVKGMPWAFSYKDLAVTHETDQCYYVAGAGSFEPGDLLFVSDIGVPRIVKRPSSSERM